MAKLHELEQKRDNIARQMRSLNEEIGDNEWSEEQRTNFRSMQGELRGIDDKIEIAKEMRRLDDEEAEARSKQEDRDRAAHDATGGDEKRYQEAFDVFLRDGYSELTREQRTVMQKIEQEMRAQGVGTDSKGGFTVPKDFQSEVFEKMKAYGGVANNCQVLTTSNGRTLQWSTTDGTNDIGDFIAENSKASEQEIDFGTAELGAKKLTSKVILISNELLQDTGVAMDSLVAGRIATRIGRAESKFIIIGSGSGLQNNGLKNQVTGTVAMKTASKPGWKDVNALIHSIDPAYRETASFALGMNDSMLQLLEEEVDAQNRPLWLPAVAGMTPATIMNKKYFIDQGIEASSGTNKVMYAGDWDKFILRRVRYMQLKRLNEVYAEADQTGFLAFHRFDTLLEDTSAIKALTWKA